MSKEYELVYTSLLLKIDLKHSSSKVNIDSLLSHKHERESIYDKSLSDESINILMLLSLSSKKNLIGILGHPQTITNILHSFATSTFTQQL